MKEIRINENDAFQRLDKFITKTFPNLPKSLMYKSIRNKKIKINRKRAQIDTTLKPGDILQIFLPDEFLQEKITVFHPQNLPLDIVFENEDYLVIQKPKQLLSQPDFPDPNQDCVVKRVQDYLYRKKIWNPETEHSFTPAIANRLDFNTEGLIIAAKNAKALREINQAIQNRQIHKYYRCEVEGNTEYDHEKIILYMKKEETMAKVFDHPGEGLMKAEMIVTTLSNEKNSSLIEIELITGRFHQIRACMAYLGHPLVGDMKYGKGKEEGYSLTAYKIENCQENLNLPHTVEMKI